MKENVGRTDQAVRAVVGPLLLISGYAWLREREGRGGGLLAMIAGALITETALTRTCPLNELLGIDTRGSGEQASAGRPRPFALLPGGAGRLLRRVPTPPETAATEEAQEEGAARRRGMRIDYSHFLNAAASLSFIRDEQVAEKAVRAVLGILVRRLEKPEAMRLVASLPDPLSYEYLQAYPADTTDLSVDQYYDTLSRQFHLTRDHAQVLAVTILRLVKEALDTEGMRDIERSLPGEWGRLIERV